MKQSTLKANTGTNLIVRTMQNLVKDGWYFTVKYDIVTQASNQSTGEEEFFHSAGELKSWIEMKSEDY